MLKLVVLSALLTVGFAYAERSPMDGKKLAQAAVQQLKQLEPLVLEGRGLADVSTSIYYRTFLNPIVEILNRWPVMGDEEFHTWGDYLYCRDALLALQTMGMGQSTSALSGENLKRKVSDYQRIKGKCQTASRLSPDQI